MSSCDKQMPIFISFVYFAADLCWNGNGQDLVSFSFLCNSILYSFKQNIPYLTTSHSDSFFSIYSMVPSYLDLFFCNYIQSCIEVVFSTLSGKAAAAALVCACAVNWTNPFDLVYTATPRSDQTVLLQSFNTFWTLCINN